jgi:hypothetical protein
MSKSHQNRIQVFCVFSKQSVLSPCPYMNSVYKSNAVSADIISNRHFISCKCVGFAWTLNTAITVSFTTMVTFKIQYSNTLIWHHFHFNVISCKYT